MDRELHILNSMCWSENYDLDLAKDLMDKTDLNQIYDSVLQYTQYTYRTTLLEQAVNGLNISMVRLLLECGADPNHIDPENEADNVFWNLQYPGRTNSESEMRIEIAKEMLRHGASPNLKVNGEDLFSYVCFFVFHGKFDEDWEYRTKFLILLIIYGGGSDYYRLNIIGSFDENRMNQYYIKIGSVNEEGSLHCSIYDRKKNIIAVLQECK